MLTARLNVNFDISYTISWFELDKPICFPVVNFAISYEKQEKFRLTTMQLSIQRSAKIIKVGLKYSTFLLLDQ